MKGVTAYALHRDFGDVGRSEEKRGDQSVALINTLTIPFGISKQCVCGFGYTVTAATRHFGVGTESLLHRRSTLPTLSHTPTVVYSTSTFIVDQRADTCQLYRKYSCCCCCCCECTYQLYCTIHIMERRGVKTKIENWIQQQSVKLFDNLNHVTPRDGASSNVQAPPLSTFLLIQESFTTLVWTKFSLTDQKSGTNQGIQ